MSLKYVDDYLLTSLDIKYEKLKERDQTFSRTKFTDISILNNSNKRIFKAEEFTLSIEILSQLFF